MIDNYSGLSYDSFEVIENDIYVIGTINFKCMINLEMVKTYFDLDIIIYNKLPNLIRKEFTLLDDSWWKREPHTPLNSSIVSWTGDVSHIWKKFKSDEKFYLEKYNKGSDEFYYKEIDLELTIKYVLSIKNYIYENLIIDVRYNFGPNAPHTRKG